MTPEGTPQDTESGPKGLDANIEAAFAAQESSQEAPPEETAPDTTDKKSSEQPRINGRFAKKEATSEAPDPGPAEPAEASPAEPAEAVEPAPTVQPVEPPARWSDADKAKFATLPKDAQEIVLEREKSMEADYTRKTQALAEERRFVEPVAGALKHWSPYIQQLGIPPDQAIHQLFQAEYTLRAGNPQQKLDAIAHLCKTYGIRLPNGQAQPAPAADNAGEELDWTDPAVTKLAEELGQVKSVVQSVAQQNALFERQRAEQEFRTIGQTKNDDGSPKFPHWDAVRDRMIKLVAESQEDTWEDAYDTAVYMDKALRKTLHDQQTNAAALAVKAAEDKRRLEAVAKARNTGPVVTTSSPGVGGASKLKGLDAILADTMNKVPGF